VIITPTVPFPAYPIESFIDLQLDLTRLTRPVSVAGIPALSVPCGFTEAGLPYSMQIIDPAWEEATVLRVGHTYQEATKWHQ
jgi:aspartyl-tRNA(Asn)/glutamyl-tRNA(Gln) amidotransferase subunit A